MNWTDVPALVNQKIICTTENVEKNVIKSLRKVIYNSPRLWVFLGGRA